MRSLLMFAVLAGAPALAADGEALKAAAELPMKAKELRDSGLDADQVTATIDAAKEAELTAADTSAVLAAAAPLVKEHGAVENFGEFVKGKLGEGLRGEELAAAIKDAHEKKPGAAASAKPTSKPTTKPRPTRGPAVKPGLKRPGSGSNRGGGGKTRPGTSPKPGPQPGPKPKPSGGGKTRPGGR